MSIVAILNALKIASFVLAALSTIWALTQKTTVEDEQGRKRLTASGKVSVGLALAFLGLALASVYFENKAREAQAQAARQIEQEQQEQVTRMLNPLTDLQVRIVWEVPVGNEVPALGALVRRAEKDPKVITDMPDFYSSEADGDNRIHTFEFGEESPAYAHVRADGEMHLAAIVPVAGVAFIRERAVAEGVLSQPNSEGLPTGDLGFPIAQKQPRTLTYNARKNILEVEMEKRPDAVVQRTGKIPSIPDLQQSTMIVRLYAIRAFGIEHDPRTLLQIQSAMKPKSVTVEASGRFFHSKAIVSRPGSGGAPFFVVALEEQR